MAFLLNPRVLIALALVAFLGFTHLSAYRAGQRDIQNQFDAYKGEQAQLALQAEQAARDKEKLWRDDLLKSQDEAAKRESALKQAAAGARNERDRLRSAIASATGILPSDTTSTVLARASTLGALLNQCTERYQELAGKADGHASDAVSLHDGWPKQLKEN